MKPEVVKSMQQMLRMFAGQPGSLLGDNRHPKVALRQGIRKTRKGAVHKVSPSGAKIARAAKLHRLTIRNITKAAE